MWQKTYMKSTQRLLKGCNPLWNISTELKNEEATAGGALSEFFFSVSNLGSYKGVACVQS
jgi:hypothetical protein